MLSGKNEKGIAETGKDYERISRSSEARRQTDGVRFICRHYLLRERVYI